MVVCQECEVVSSIMPGVFLACRKENLFYKFRLEFFFIFLFSTDRLHQKGLRKIHQPTNQSTMALQNIKQSLDAVSAWRS